MEEKTNIELYEEFTPLLAEREELKLKLKDKNMSINENERLKESKKAVEAKLNAIASKLYRGFVKFVKDRNDLVKYSMEKHWFYRVGFTGCFYKTKSKCGSIVIKTENFTGEYYERGESIVIPKDYIYEPEAYEQRRKALMLKGRANTLANTISTLESELGRHKANLKLTNGMIDELKEEAPQLKSTRLDYKPL